MVQNLFYSDFGSGDLKCFFCGSLPASKNFFLVNYRYKLVKLPTTFQTNCDVPVICQCFGSYSLNPDPDLAKNINPDPSYRVPYFLTLSENNIKLFHNYNSIEKYNFIKSKINLL